MNLSVLWNHNHFHSVRSEIECESFRLCLDMYVCVCVCNNVCNYLWATFYELKAEGRYRCRFLHNFDLKAIIRCACGIFDEQMLLIIILIFDEAKHIQQMCNRSVHSHFMYIYWCLCVSVIM